MKIAVYPGSFDPVTNGHIDILERALKIFDKVIVLVAINPMKKTRFNVIDRVKMLKESTKKYGNKVLVDETPGLTIQYAKKVGATHLIRGLRAVSDFEYEFKLSAGNEFVDSEIDMVFLMSHKETSFISSSTIDDLFKSGVDISPLVPIAVVKMYKSKK